MAIVAETSFFGNFKQAETPRVLIISAPYEYTTSYCKGTKNGPQAILNASTYLEFFDDELWLDVRKIGINTSNFIECEFSSNKSKQPFNEIEQKVRSTVIDGSLPIVLGGEHSISYGAIKAIYDLYPDISILHFGAHLNLKDSYQNNKYGSVCTLRRVLEIIPDIKVVQIGTRSISQEEIEWLENNNSNVEIFFSRDMNNFDIAELLSNLTKNVYISFNFNVLDSGIMPSATVPEPGGLSWEQTTIIIKNICAFKEIVGMDFVGLAPIQGLIAPDYLAAKLIYKSIGYAFARQLGAFEEGRNLTGQVSTAGNIN